VIPTVTISYVEVFSMPELLLMAPWMCFHATSFDNWRQILLSNYGGDSSPYIVKDRFGEQWDREIHPYGCGLGCWFQHVIKALLNCCNITI
jgi:hypothetical protein